jgi:hypothetical protein
MLEKVWKFILLLGLIIFTFFLSGFVIQEHKSGCTCVLDRQSLHHLVVFLDLGWISVIVYLHNLILGINDKSVCFYWRQISVVEAELVHLIYTSDQCLLILEQHNDLNQATAIVSFELKSLIAQFSQPLLLLFLVIFWRYLLSDSLVGLRHVSNLLNLNKQGVLEDIIQYILIHGSLGYPQLYHLSHFIFDLTSSMGVV